jgi:hypothetical protein
VTVPVTEGVSAAIAVPTVYVCGLAYERLLGAATPFESEPFESEPLLQPAIMAIIKTSTIRTVNLNIGILTLLIIVSLSYSFI